MSNPTQIHPFPVYYRHREASCFNCGGDFGDGYPFESGHAPGHGKWVQECEKCRMAMFYDIERDPDEALEEKRDRAREAR